MKIAIIADGRAENFRRWARFFIQQGDDVSVISSIACDNVDGAGMYILPTVVRTSNALVKRSDRRMEDVGVNGLRRRVMQHGLDRGIYLVWSIVKTVNILPQAVAVRRIIRDIKPDVTVAFRVQNEGYVGAFSGAHPLILFTQGSDFIYMAERSRWHACLTRFSVRRADAVMSDCLRDIRLAGIYGLSASRPTRLLPGNGGVDLSLYRPGLPAEKRSRTVIYVRGLVPYVRMDTLLKSIHDLQQDPDYEDVRYKLIGTPAVIPAIESMVRKEGIDVKNVDVLPFMPQAELVSLLQEAAVMVSPSLTDGSPNSMLEAMACGIFPVMGDLESIREWISPGKNGLLFDPAQPRELVRCLKTALDDVCLRLQAQDINLDIIRKRADYSHLMPEIRQFIADVSGVHGQGGFS